MRFICLVLVLSVAGIHAQVVRWIDTLKYSNCTGINSLLSDNSGNVIAYGGFDEGYAGNSASSRALLIKVDQKDSISILDSSTTRSGAGPISDGNHLYVAFWLDGTGTTPKIAGTIYPEGTYLVKYTPGGSVVWAKKQSFHGIPTDMGIDKLGLVYVLYNTSGGPVLYRYDQNGNQISHLFPWGAKLRFDSGNNLFMTGTFNLRKLDYSGNLLWSKYASNDALLEVDDKGNSYVLYNDIEVYDPNGNFLWTKPLTNTSGVRLRVEGENLYMVYTTGSGTGWSSPNVLEKLDPKNGNVIWTIQIPFSEDQPFFPNAITSDHGLVYFSCYTPEYLSTILVGVEDKGYIPVATSLSGQQKKSGQLTVAPNPSNGRIRLGWNSEESTAYIKVYDASGRTVFNREGVSQLEGDENLDLSFLEKGVYLVEVKDTKSPPRIRRLVIQ